MDCRYQLALRAKVRAKYPETVVTIGVKPGDRLSELPHQGSYRYVIGVVYLGAQDRADLQEKYDGVVAALPFEFEPVDREEAGAA